MVDNVCVLVACTCLDKGQYELALGFEEVEEEIPVLISQSPSSLALTQVLASSNSKS